MRNQKFFFTKNKKTGRYGYHKAVMVTPPQEELWSGNGELPKEYQDLLDKQLTKDQEKEELAKSELSNAVLLLDSCDNVADLKKSLKVILKKSGVI